MSKFELECFEGNAEPAPEPAAPGDYDAGYAAGLAAARMEHEAQLADGTARIAQSLSDTHIGYAEASAAALEALTPLLQAIATAVVPACLGTTVREHVADLLSQTANTDLTESCVLLTNPDQLAMLSEAELPAEPRLQAADHLQPGQFVLTTDRAETMLDLSIIETAIRESLETITEPRSLQDYG